MPEIKIENKSVFSLVDSAVDTTLPAFAAERRAAAPCCGTVLQHRAAAPCCGAVLRHRAAAPCCGTVLQHGAAARCHSTVLQHRAVAPCCGAVVQHRAAAPLLLGAQRSPLSIDISSPHGAQQQTRRTPLLRSNDGRHGRTKTRPLHRPCSAFCAGSANNVGAGPWPLPLFSFVFRWSEETQIIIGLGPLLECGALSLRGGTVLSNSLNIGNESVPIQLGQCWFPGLAVSNTKI